MYRYRRSVAIGKELEKKINRILLVLIVTFILPVFITTFCSRIRVEELFKNRAGEGVSEVERILPLIVAREIEIDKPDECIKAQTVIARTNLMAAEHLGQETPQGLTVAQLRELWGEEFEAYYERMEKLIAETAGEILTYEGEPIYAAYHRSSAGNTRNMSEFAGSEKMPYLVSRDCHEDVVAEDYLGVFVWEKETFLRMVRDAFPENNPITMADIKITERDSAGYALKVWVGQTLYDGETFRKRLALPSACMEITELEEDVRVVTMGCGHGFGLSQYAACCMAKNGATYQEILAYFYKDTVLTE